MPDGEILDDTLRREVIVGAIHWTPKEINLSAFQEVAYPILRNVESAPTSFARCELLAQSVGSKGQGNAGPCFVEQLGEYLAARRTGLIVGQTGGGLKLKTIEYIFQSAADRCDEGQHSRLALAARTVLFNASGP
jgi:hypothetical protein